jgi:hypothetical protein
MKTPPMTSPYSPLLDEQVAAGLRGDFKRGWEIAVELKRTHPDCNRAKFNRAWYEMMRGDLLTGLELLDSGRWEKAFGDAPLPTQKGIWRNEDLTGKHLLLCSEGGLGDEIINARFAKDFADKGAKVTVTCDAGLASAFTRINGVSTVVLHKGAPFVYHDFWVPAMSAARVLGKTYSNLSGQKYLSADPQKVLEWKEILKDHGSPKIGLRFFGNPKFEHEQHRKFPVDGLIKSLGGRPWANLQLEETKLPLKNWEDTLALIENLDLVITSCTSVAHASAALGKKTWVITPILPYYVWAEPGNKSSWYDSVRIFRQERFGDWSNVFSEIENALKSNL